ncbi:hypothetical protein [Bradyrhizobium sp. WSM2793]|nr:hypothetical protein [Bradyrhizobium sp. WSM2793]
MANKMAMTMGPLGCAGVFAYGRPFFGQHIHKLGFVEALIRRLCCCFC